MSSSFPYLGFVILKDGQINYFGCAIDYKNHDKGDGALYDHVASLKLSMQEVSYDVTKLEVENIYRAAKILQEDGYIVYVNFLALSKNREGVLFVNINFTEEQKETLIKLESFFEGIENMVIEYWDSLYTLHSFYSVVQKSNSKKLVLKK